MLSAAVKLEMFEEVGRANGNRGQVIGEWAAMLGVSDKTIYRELKKMGLKTGRRERRDRGIVRGVTGEELKQVASVMMESWTEKYREPIMPAWKAIELAERMGIIAPGILTPTVFNGWLRNYNISKKNLAERTPYQPMKSDYPNQTHQYDVSVCAQWYLANDGSIGHQRRNLEVYKNKEGKPKQLKRHLLVDHFSGAFFPLYLLSENTRDSLEFLFSAWQVKRAELMFETMGIMGEIGDMGGMGERLERVCERFHFRGAPDILYTDQGTAVKGAVGQQVLDRLGIEYIAHEKGNARATGTVEGNMWIWERAFESELKLFPAKSLLELNVRALETALKYQVEKRHSRHGLMRLECWAKIPAEKLRELPDNREILRSLAMRANEKRGIDYKGVILFDGNVYKVPDQGLWGKKCLVGPDVFSVERNKRNRTNGTEGTYDIFVECEGKKFKLAAVEKDANGFMADAPSWGDYKRPKDTVTEKRVKEVARDLSGYDLQDIQVEGLRKFEDPEGTELELEEQVAERVFTRVGAKAEVIRRLGYAPLIWQANVIEEFTREDTEITESRMEEIMMRLERRDVEVV